jgi:hypothetical protein
MMKDEETQNSFVSSTQKDCQLLSATGSVHWEWFYGWLQAFGGYFPKYADQGEGKGTVKDCIQLSENNLPMSYPSIGPKVFEYGQNAKVSSEKSFFVQSKISYLDTKK